MTRRNTVIYSYIGLPDSSAMHERKTDPIMSLLPSFAVQTAGQLTGERDREPGPGC
jgi:hypothetical protein